MTSKQKNHQHVIIKGTRDGLTFLLDDLCSLDTLKAELQVKLSEHPHPASTSHGPIKVQLVTGKRYLDTWQLEELEALLSNEMNVNIDHVESDVITKIEAEENRENRQMTRILKIIRSGQILELKGDILLIGDVNPGGLIKASGNIFILGKLRGIAHAGSTGNEDAVICASTMSPSQLRIASIISRPPDTTDQEDKRKEDVECAYVNEKNEMILDKLQNLSTVRPNLVSEL